MNTLDISPRLMDLVMPSAADLGWQDAALCAQTDPEVFFPEQGGSPREAKSTCRACVVRLECLGYALDRAEPDGVWGGLSPEERWTASARQAQGVSLKDIIADDDEVFYDRQEALAERSRERDRKYAAANRAAVAALTAQPPQSRGAAA